MDPIHKGTTILGGAAALVFEYVEEEEPFSIIYGVSYKVSPY